MTDAEIALIVRDAFAQSVCESHINVGNLCGFVRVQGAEIRVIYPQGYEAELARMFYRAADEMVSRIKGAPSMLKN